jgi:hypothetical protein
MALVAGQIQMPSAQRKTGRRIVVERRMLPIYLIVTAFAVF